jgi:hypothetical protein
MGAGALAREHECYAGGGCVRIELRAGGGGRRHVWPCSAQGTPRRSSPPRRACTARRGPHHHRGATPPSLHRARKTFPARSTSVTRHRDTDTSRAPSTRAEPHRSKQAASTPSATVEPHAPTTAAVDEDVAEALRGEVARAGDSDRADAPVESALVDRRLDAIETMRNRWCAPTVEVDLPPGLASTSAIGSERYAFGCFHWRHVLWWPLLLRDGLVQQRDDASGDRGAGTGQGPRDVQRPGGRHRVGRRGGVVLLPVEDSLRCEKYSSRYLQQHMTMSLFT